MSFFLRHDVLTIELLLFTYLHCATLNGNHWFCVYKIYHLTTYVSFPQCGLFFACNDTTCICASVCVNYFSKLYRLLNSIIANTNDFLSVFKPVFNNIFQQTLVKIKVSNYIYQDQLLYEPIRWLSKILCYLKPLTIY